MTSTRRLLITLLLATGLLPGCRGEGSGDPIRVHVPAGASFRQVTDSLAAHDIVRAPRLFMIYGRISGAAGRVKPGTYAFRPNTGWQEVADALVEGRVLTDRVVIPEGLDLRGIAPRMARISTLDADSVLATLLDSATVARHGVPGPTMEGYLYPATYTFSLDTPLDTMIAQMVRTYRRVWTEERRAAAEAIGMSEREVMTLASIVEREARVRTEMPIIAAVFHNRLRIGYLLQADPTVQYALGVHRARLTFPAIDSVADNPYNTYRNRGLPPGPIASPSTLAIDAVLNPADTDVLYFVARPDGSHIFTRTNEEHNRARVESRRLFAEQARQQGSARPEQPDNRDDGSP
jgi:UPF0755 protein